MGEPETGDPDWKWEFAAAPPSSMDPAVERIMAGLRAALLRYQELEDKFVSSEKDGQIFKQCKAAIDEVTTAMGELNPHGLLRREDDSLVVDLCNGFEAGLLHIAVKPPKKFWPEIRRWLADRNASKRLERAPQEVQRALVADEPLPEHMFGVLRSLVWIRRIGGPPVAW